MLRFILKGFICLVLYFNSIPWGIAISPPKDSAYRVAMIFPFHFYNYFGTNVNRSNIMLDYYQGFYLGLKEFESRGLNIKLYIYDNEHDTVKTREILTRSEMPEMDLIISPILNEHLHLMNHFSSKNQKAVLSPFTAIDSLFPNNPLFFNAAPAEKTKAEIFYDYFRKTTPGSTVLIIKNDLTWNDGFGPELEKLLQTKDKIDYRIVASTDIAKADSHFLSREKDYIVYHQAASSKEFKSIIPFFDKQKVNIKILSDYKPIVLKGIPSAKREKFNIRIISSDFTNPMDSAIIMRDFKNTYKSLYNFNPSRYSVIGHDQASFIAEMFLKYDRFRANDFIGESYLYYATKFLFKKDRHCNQNKGLFILKISENEMLEEVKY